MSSVELAGGALNERGIGDLNARAIDAHGFQPPIAHITVTEPAPRFSGEQACTSRRLSVVNIAARNLRRYDS